MDFSHFTGTKNKAPALLASVLFLYCRAVKQMVGGKVSGKALVQMLLLPIV